MLKIVSPITNIHEVDALIDAGAAEFYCGVLTEQENRRLTNIFCLNRRPSLFSNLSSFLELEKLVKKAKSSDAKVSFTLNEFYTDEQFPSVIEQAKKAADCGVDAFIVCDLGLIRFLRQTNPKARLHVGVGGTTFNSQTMAFYKKLGAKRVILPRQLTIKEIESISLKNKEIELECLILNERCHFIDGYCNFLHSAFSYRSSLLGFFKYDRFKNKLWSLLPQPIAERIHIYGMKKEVACCFKYKAQAGMCFGEKETNALENFFNPLTFLYACGACSLFDLNNAGINSLKIVGRVSFKDKAKDVRFIRYCLEELEKAGSRQEFIAKAKEIYFRIYKKNCDKRYCYYPGE